MTILQEIAETTSAIGDTPWYYLALAFAFAGAALQHGSNALFTGWEKELKLPIWFSVIGDVAGIVIASILGASVGSIAWNWHLGFATAFTGAVASKLILSMIRAKLGISEKTKDDENLP